jgi:hypothetical protein
VSPVRATTSMTFRCSTGNGQRFFAFSDMLKQYLTDGELAFGVVGQCFHDSITGRCELREDVKETSKKRHATWNGKKCDDGEKGLS